MDKIRCVISTLNELSVELGVDTKAKPLPIPSHFPYSTKWVRYSKFNSMAHHRNQTDLMIESVWFKCCINCFHTYCARSHRSTPNQQMCWSIKNGFPVMDTDLGQQIFWLKWVLLFLNFSKTFAQIRGEQTTRLNSYIHPYYHVNIEFSSIQFDMEWLWFWGRSVSFLNASTIKN